MCYRCHGNSTVFFVYGAQMFKSPAFIGIVKRSFRRLVKGKLLAFVAFKHLLFNINNHIGITFILTFLSLPTLTLL